MTVLIVMGVSGAGKSTLGAALASRLGWDFQEGDALHPAANIAKMQAGEALDDADRAPWLARVKAWIDREIACGRSGVVTCSALKRAYRRLLISQRAAVRLVYLAVPRAELEGRLRARHGHFMPPGLLESQLAALEPPDASEAPIVVGPEDTVEAVAERVLALGAEARRTGPWV